MDHTGFLADILDHPEDDTLRLIYADWLQDNGQAERAERIQELQDMERLLLDRHLLRSCCRPGCRISTSRLTGRTKRLG